MIEDSHGARSNMGIRERDLVLLSLFTDNSERQTATPDLLKKTGTMKFNLSGQPFGLLISFAASLPFIYLAAIKVSIATPRPNKISD
jgi:hypothetical protein